MTPYIAAPCSEAAGRDDAPTGLKKPLGHGIGLRATHFEAWLERAPDVAFAECITENYIDVGGRPRAMLEHVRAAMPVVLHGVSLSIGSVDPIDEAYIASVKRLADAVDPAWVSDHLCWSSVGGQHLHDLLPLPYTEEALVHVAARVQKVQDLLGRPLVLENPATYVTFVASALTEWEFLAELARRTGAGLLLDINNVYVSARNHGWSTDAYLAGIPVETVWQFHLAGHSDFGTHVVDTHDQPVCDAVWALHRRAVARFGRVATLVEWDDRIPELDVVVAESRRARANEREVLGSLAASPAEPRCLEAEARGA